jgi:hypothetical protein
MRNRTGAVILRRRSDFWIGLLSAVGMMVAIAYSTFNSDPPYDVQLALAQLAFLAVAWFCWGVAAHPRIMVTSEGLAVVNWFTRTDIPWSAVDSFDVESGRLEIVSNSGRRIRPLTGGDALAAALNKHRVQNDLRDTLEHWRLAAEPSATPVRRRFYMPLWFPVVGALVLAVCSLFV